MPVYLLVQVDEGATDQLFDDLASYPGVVSVEEHGEGCCCKHCPWAGNHG